VSSNHSAVGNRVATVTIICEGMCDELIISCKPMHAQAWNVADGCEPWPKAHHEPWSSSPWTVIQAHHDLFVGSAEPIGYYRGNHTLSNTRPRFYGSCGPPSLTVVLHWFYQITEVLYGLLRELPRTLCKSCPALVESIHKIYNTRWNLQSSWYLSDNLSSADHARFLKPLRI
jgi:hypothetical protein